MTIGTIKKIEKTQQGAWSISMEDKTSFLCFEKMGILEDLRQGDKIEYESERKTAKSGRDYFVLRNPRYPEQKPATTAVTQAANNYYNKGGMNNDWQIFVTGVVGRAMGSGKFELTDLRGLSLAAVEAWYAINERKQERDKGEAAIGPVSDDDFPPF